MSLPRLQFTLQRTMGVVILAGLLLAFHVDQRRRVVAFEAAELSCKHVSISRERAQARLNKGIKAVESADTNFALAAASNPGWEEYRRAARLDNERPLQREKDNLTKCLSVESRAKLDSDRIRSSIIWPYR